MMTRSSLVAGIVAALIMSQMVLPAVAEMPRFDEINWHAYTSENFEKLREDQQPMLVFCRADWCPSCVLMEATLLKREKLREYVVKNKIAMVKLDFTEKSKVADEFMKAHNVKAVPAFLFFPQRRTRNRQSNRMSPPRRLCSRCWVMR